MPLTPRMRRMAIEGGFVLMVLVLLLVVLEGTLRLIGDEAPSRPAARAEAALPILHKTSDLARPNTRGLNAGALYQSNSAGFRGREHPERKPLGVFRLAVIGDSTSMGWGVEWKDTYAARIERRLNSANSTSSTSSTSGSLGAFPPSAADSSRRFEVLNFALAGLDASGVSKRFESLALRFDPDVVIYGFTLNDIKGEHYRPSLDREYAESLRRNDAPLRLWRWARPRWLAIRELLFAPKGTYAGELDDNYFNNPRARQALQSHLARIASLSDDRAICRILLIHSQIQSLHALHPYRRHYEVVADLAREQGFYTAQSLEAMSAEAAPSLWVSPSDWHANARGHAILADVAMDALSRLPASCWNRPAHPSPSAATTHSQQGSTAH